MTLKETIIHLKKRNLNENVINSAVKELDKLLGIYEAGCDCYATGTFEKDRFTQIVIDILSESEDIHS